MKIQYQKASLKEVMEYYVDAFKVDLWDYEFFVDQSKDAVIFKLIINEDSDNEGLNLND